MFSTDFVDEVSKYFKKNNWENRLCNMCGNTVYFKSYTDGICPACNLVNVNNSNRKRKSFPKDFYKTLQQYILGFFRSNYNRELIKANPLSIWKAINDQIFVGSGLEYLYGYFYNGKELPKLPALIFQPSIRLRLDLKELKENAKCLDLFSGIAFCNMSLLRLYQGKIKFMEELDLLISFLSHCGIHAKRVRMVLDPTQHELKENFFSSAIKIYIDNLEVGDQVLIQKRETNIMVVETGLGLERLVTRMLNLDYMGAIMNKNNNLEHRAIVIIQALVLISMSNIPFSKFEIWNKTKTLANCLAEITDYVDSCFVFNRLYDFWANFMDEPADRTTALNVYLKIMPDRFK